MSSSVRMRQASGSLARDPVGKLIVRFGLPSIVAMLTMSLYNIVDQLFIGHGVGYLGNAATNVVFPFVILSIALSMIFGEGATALYSIRLGEGNTDEARRTAGNGIIMLAVTGVIVSMIALLVLKPMLGFLGATERVMPYALEYAGPIVFGSPFQVVAGGLNALIRANGSPKYAMMAMATGAILNTILDPIFIFTFDMGVEGAAVATAISQFAGFCISAAYLLRPHRLGLARRHFRPCIRLIGRIMATGSAPALSQLAIMVVIVSMNNALGKYGAQSQYGAEIPLAAHGITMKVNQILYSVLIGLSMGAQPVIGFNYGAKNFLRVRKTFLTAVTLAVTTGTLAFIVFFFFPHYIIMLFGREEALYNEFSRRSFQTFLFFTFINGFTLMSGTFFQSMAKPLHAAAIQLSRQVLVMVPMVHILPRFWGISGVLLSGPVSDVISFTIACVLVSRQLHRLKHMAETGEVPEPLPNPEDTAEPGVVSGNQM